MSRSTPEADPGLTLGALDRLIEAVEAGSMTDRVAARSGMSLVNAGLVISAYHGSLDAALALHEALLSRDCHWSVCEDDDRGYVARVILCGWHEGISPTPARAFLLAILRAYRAQQVAG